MSRAARARVDGPSLERAIAAQTIKAGLRTVTRQAWDAGVRGVPSLRIGTAIFYGDDRLELAARRLQPMTRSIEGANRRFVMT